MKEMLVSRLYTIKGLHWQEENKKLSIKICLNPLHEVFSGHFPGNPVLPGVCIVHILKEILSGQLSKELMLNEAASIKYVSVINPVEVSMINCDVELKEMANEKIFCNAVFYSGSVIFCRLKGNFKIINK